MDSRLKHVDREERRERFRQDALKAWDSYRQTGLHVTADEADAWLESLVKGKDVAPPECHVRFGDSGYIALYRYDGTEAAILAVRHQKEAGF